MRQQFGKARSGGLLLGLIALLAATAGSAGASSGRADIESLRDRARLMSAFQGLGATYTSPLARGAAATKAALPWLAAKRGQSSFAPAAGSLRSASGWANVGIGVDPEQDENEPTVVANPRDKDILVAGSHFLFPPAFLTEVGRCVAHASRDAGRSWSAPVLMPQLTPESQCADPVLAYSPDGSRVYFAYMDIKDSETIVGDPENPDLITVESDLDVLVSHSDNGGRTWQGPVVALNGDPSSQTFDFQTGELLEFDPGFDFDKPWIAAHVASRDQGEGIRKRVYVSATRFDVLNPGFACTIVVTRSLNRGTTWRTPVDLESSVGDCADPVLVQGSRPSAGSGRQVVVAWFNSGRDGFLQGSFKIRTAFSTDGKRWRAPRTAVRDSFEPSFFLGPFGFYHRWGATVFPDVEIAQDGRAHIVYTHDPEENGFTFVDPETGEEFFDPGTSTTAEDGDIRYITSRRAPFRSWSRPRTLNDDGLIRAQGFPALETLRQRNGKIALHVIWEDHRLSPEGPTDPDRFGESSNLYYDVFKAIRRPGNGWSRNTRVTDERSISDFLFNGDYFDITTSGPSLVFGIWTDRRHQNSIGASLDQNGEVVLDEAALEDNVFGARLR
jgi:hypothetical protein